MTMARVPKPDGADNPGSDQHGRLAEECEDPGRFQQSRTMTGIKPLVDGAIERPAAPHEHGEPDRRERDQRRGEPDIGGAWPDR
jgi:hypothetical protein